MVKTYFGCGQQGKDTSSDQLLHSPGCRYTDHHSHALVLPIKGTWFRMILSGEKLEEYREIKPYWEKRFSRYFGQHYDFFSNSTQSLLVWNTEKKDIVFRNGYGNGKPEFTAKCTIREGYGNLDWGAERGKQYYILTIHGIH